VNLEPFSATRLSEPSIDDRGGGLFKGVQHRFVVREAICSSDRCRCSAGEPATLAEFELLMRPAGQQKGEEIAAASGGYASLVNTHG
jgi:hypothetical protein